MKMHKYLFLISCLIPILFSGCATTGTRHIFITEDIQTLHPGMSLDELKLIFGEPDTSYSMEFGGDTEREWNALVVKYFGKRDKAYRYFTRYLTNQFVFYIEGNEMKLNNWNIEFQDSGKG